MVIIPGLLDRLNALPLLSALLPDDRRLLAELGGFNDLPGGAAVTDEGAASHACSLRPRVATLRYRRRKCCVVHLAANDRCGSTFNLAFRPHM